MKKAGTDPKVKKTLVRNYETKVRIERKGVHDIDAGPSKSNKNTLKPLTQRDINLDEPTLCSSEVLASYLSDVRKSVPPPISSGDLNLHESQNSAKITKKLNFHFNDRIYNLNVFYKKEQYIMKKAGTDPKVKKTLVRNYETKVRIERKGVHDIDAGPSKSNKNTLKPLTQRDINLDEPTLCSSEVLASYLSDVRKSVPPPISSGDLNLHESQNSAKITKKLNFHFNDRIYKNLVELNADITNSQNKQDKKTTKNKTSLKKDLEPHIEDFFQEEKEPDISPNIPILKRNVTLLKGVEDGRLHRLIASFEKL